MKFKQIRILLLLLVLFYVAFDRLLSDQRVTSWKHSLRVVIYPINADGSELTQRYIESLNREQFDDIEQALQQQAARYGLDLSDPIDFDLAPPLTQLPPALPKETAGLGVMLWTLKLRYWSWKHDNYRGITPHIRAYALYYNPKTHKRLAHSTGLKEGKITLMNLFASMENNQQNNVIVLHELLHTLGATDKYDIRTGIPSYPHGFAEPNRQPAYPQRFAEIMGGRIILSPEKAVIPEGVNKTMVGEQTAREIGWLK